MKIIQKFLNKVVEKYNSKTLTPKELNDIYDTYMKTFEDEKNVKGMNLSIAYSIATDTFKKQKGKKVEKLTFQWKRTRKSPNLYYDD